MDAREFDMLHDRRNKGVRAVRNGVGFGFNGVLQISLNQNRAFRRKFDGDADIFAQHLLVIDDFHRPPAKDVRRPHDERIADLLRHRERLVHRASHARFRLRNAHLAHHLAEQVAVFGQINLFGAGAENFDAGGG